MKKQIFDYFLPEALIAQTPLPERSASRLLSLDGRTGQVADRSFRDLAVLLQPGDLLVFNDTRVIPARLHGRKQSGGAVELMLERLASPRQAWAQARASKPLRPDMEILLAEQVAVRVLGREGDLFLLESPADLPWPALLEQFGEMPLPPYIARQADTQDSERYQTVFARRPGAVAAPTAGLHFDQALLDTLSARGIEQASVTLHVGAGTFQPVRCEDIREHHMHSEYLEVPESTVAAIAAARARGGRVVAVGTTSLRALEAAAESGTLQPFAGETRLFIYPGYRFRVVDALITNFHLPQSTLLMLVCAFAGIDKTLGAYAHAVAQGYRFFSYGDAMFVTPESPETGNG
ncbi:tRNA preQ1(34) S-adenosylmethionine ribosyltransferase-isomerase QueA [Thermithiobacillus plumbiphilus]|uniref:S-adenosylmethionine:tRNA ribosyltransferase-isomerase n=1 Tax=Thermithiobacillus plumbiphilus TaxID=1729899 RepID=A0ABU9DAW6_9PROT